METKNQGLPFLYGIDVSDGVARFGGAAERFYATLKKFADVKNRIPPFELCAALDPDAKAQIHTLKGVAGNLSIMRLHSLCVSFEASMKDGAADEGIYAELCEEQALVIRGLDEWAGAGENAGAGKLTDGECAGLLKALLEALALFEPSLCELKAQKLKGAWCPSFSAKEISALCDKVSGYEYDEAAAIAEAMLQRLP